MRITDYTFGRIVIEDRTYTSDVIIYPKAVNDRWWRKEGHKLQVEDLAEIVDAKPDCLVIGTGYNGSMTVPEKTLEFLAASGIESRVARTREAVDLFNQLQKSNPKIVAALHLTC